MTLLAGVTPTLPPNMVILGANTCGQNTIESAIYTVAIIIIIYYLVVVMFF